MFNMTKIGKKISELRKAKNMTQNELADRLSISYQAVSNWERGQTMPDISKLSEISQILSVSIDELLGESNSVVNSVIKGEKIVLDSEDKKEELIEVAPILKPNTLEEIEMKVPEDSENMDNQKSDNSYDEDSSEKSIKFSLEDIIAIAPFLSEKKLSEFVDSMEYEGNDSLESICGIAPFLNEKKLFEIAMKSLNKNKGKSIEITCLAPFLNEKDLVTIVSEVIDREETNLESMTGLIPFIGSAEVSKIANKILEKNNGFEKTNVVAFAPFMNSEDILSLFEKYPVIESELLSFAPFMNSRQIKDILLKIVSEDKKKAKTILTSIAPFIKSKHLEEVMMNIYSNK